MRHIVVLGLVAGIALLTALVAHYGLHAIVHALTTLGWGGFAVVIGFHLLLIAMMGSAWWLLGVGRPDARAWRFMWGRLIRESGAEALPFSQLGGFVLGARAVTLTGVSSAFAAASTVVDISVEMVSQLGYTLLGLGLLAWLQPENPLVGPILAGIVFMAVLAITFIVVQARCAGWADRGLACLAQSWFGMRPGRTNAVRTEIHEIHGRRAMLALSGLTHLSTWLLNGVEAWITLRLMGVPLGLGAVLIIDSLLYGIRSAAFFVPNAIGVQEGGYVMLGGLFGVAPDVAMALSLVRRGRDLVIGVPALLVWQLVEGRRAWRAAPAVEDGLPESPPAS